jgi:hypothetical protein
MAQWNNGSMEKWLNGTMACTNGSDSAKAIHNAPIQKAESRREKREMGKSRTPCSGDIFLAGNLPSCTFEVKP